MKIPITISGKLTIAALEGLAVIEGLGVYLLEGELPPVAIVIILFLVALALLIMVGRWWINLLVGILIGLLFLVPLVGGMSTFTDPSDPGFFSALAFLALTLIATIAGIWSAVQTRQPV